MVFTINHYTSPNLSSPNIVRHREKDSILKIKTMAGPKSTLN